MRAGARIRSNMHALMLSPAECETVFARYSRADPDAPASVSKAEQLLPYEMFLAALVHLASKLVRPDVPFLSEGVREYILKYVGKADRVATTGAKKGQLRAVLEGTARGSGILAAAPSAALSAGAGAGGGIAAERTASTSSSPAANGKRAGKAGRVRSALPSKRSPAGGEVAGVELTVPRSPVTGERLVHSPSSAAKGGDRPTSAIMRELTLLGLDPGAGVNKEPIRRGGGFDLPC